MYIGCMVPQRNNIGLRSLQFSLRFWQEFLKLSSSHHPKMNRACERTNGVLEQYLRYYINYQQDNWTDLLSFAEIAYNISVHGSTGLTPFKVASGQDFLSIFKLPQATHKLPA